MSRNRIAVEAVLLQDEREAIDRFAIDHQGEGALPAWSELLAQRFSLDLHVDPDIVDGLTTDCSNLPGHARAGFRPTNEHACAVAARMCTQAGIPLTVSAGRTSLTGSATPNGGVVLSLTKMPRPAVRVDSVAKTHSNRFHQHLVITGSYDTVF